MGKITGFIEINRNAPKRIPVAERILGWEEFYKDWPEKEIQQQGSRCMNCAVPFCHQGCPLGNLIPDWNDLVYRGRWKEALFALHQTNNFPEFTGRICPAPCEASCVLSINEEPVTIEYIEKAIVDYGFRAGWIQPTLPEKRTGKSVAVIGSGPAGLAAAAQLNRAGHWVTVFERDELPGGLLSLGIPDFKLDKRIVTRRITLLEEEGITFQCNTNVGVDIPIADLQQQFQAICLTGGSTVPRPLNIPGSELNGIHFAMDYLTQQNRMNTGSQSNLGAQISAKGKNVVILGGGDTGSDCLGTAHRQGAASIYNFELLPQPPESRDENNPWPQWPLIMRSSHAHEEGGIRDYSILTKAFSGKDGNLTSLKACQIKMGNPDANGRPVMEEIPGSEFEIPTELVLLAMGFLHPQHDGMLKDLNVSLDNRGNVITDLDKATSLQGIFAAGDMARGQSLVVWAIAEGRQAAYGIDKYLMGNSSLPTVNLNSWVPSR